MLWAKVTSLDVNSGMVTTINFTNKVLALKVQTLSQEKTL